jgi:hypothetical protein
MSVTSDTQPVADWILMTYRVPPEPSRHRVAVWRELRKAGAVPLQQATWVVPARREFAEAVARAVALVDRGGGEALVLDVAGRDEPTRARLEQMFTEAREEEWTEFLSECAKFAAEIEREIQTSKFTAAELDEEEQNIERLRRWFRELRARDLFVAPSQEPAELRLKGCVEMLEDFSERVYQAGGHT